MANKLYNDISIQSIADAIRAKNDSSDTYTVSEMGPAILAIPSGGDTPDAPDNDVILIDFTGRRFASYTAAEFLALNEYPEPPAHDLLTADGYNYTLADAKTYVQNYGALTIGALYRTTDGKTYIHVTVQEGRKSVKFTIGQNNSIIPTIIVDWGDETTDTYTPEQYADIELTHTYTGAGEYLISIEISSYLNLATCKLTHIVSTTLDATAYNTCTAIDWIYLGNKITRINGEGFRYCCRMKVISLPRSLTTITSTYLFVLCYQLEALIMPTLDTCSMQTIGAYGARYVSIPKQPQQVRKYWFNSLFYLTRLETPEYDSNGTVENYVTGSYALSRLIIPNGVWTLNSTALSLLDSLTDLTLHDKVVSIGTNALRLRTLKTLRMKATTPPTLQSTSLTDIPSDCQIIVPYSADHSVLQAYQTATNWSTYAAQMIEEDPS